MRRIQAVIIVLAVAIGLEAFLIIPTASKVRDFAAQGRDARITQCRVWPINVRVYTAARRYRIISQRDLETFKRAAPDCPRPARRPGKTTSPSRSTGARG